GRGGAGGVAAAGARGGAVAGGGASPAARRGGGGAVGAPLRRPACALGNACGAGAAKRRRCPRPSAAHRTRRLRGRAVLVADDAGEDDAEAGAAPERSSAARASVGAAWAGAPAHAVARRSASPAARRR